MEAEHTRPADGERSGGQQQPVSESSLRGRVPQLHLQATSRPIHGSHGRHQHRQPKRSDMLQRQQQQQSQVGESSWQLSDVPGPSGGSYSSSPLESSTQVSRVPRTTSQPSQDLQEGTPPRRERKPQKPGKYVCTYCGRPCAKPSVLQKHIRSHTGERPYPCVPCGFSFKTKSNLYKHRKSHAHRIKAGLASRREEHSFSGPDSGTVVEDQEEVTEAESTDSEDETGQRRPSTSQERPALRKSSKVELSFSEEGPRTEDSQAVKQRLAMRLSERKRVPMASPDETPSSSLGPGSKGSTESGYFSSHGSAELSQVSPPNANAKSYAEIILGKYGRLGHQQRISHQHLQSPTSSSSSLGQDEKSISFTVPKTQVIEHITKLITINEAVVDTSEIDSVKPRRSSISRRSSIESPKFSLPKDPYVYDSKADAPGSSGGSSQILSGFASEGQCSQLAEDTLAGHCSSAVLLRSQSVPSSGGQDDLPSISSHSYRLSHSFDEQQAAAAEMRVGPQHRMLRRQPAIEMPIGVDPVAEAIPSTSSLTESGWKCEVCGTCLTKKDNYAAHRAACTKKPLKECQSEKKDSAVREDRPQMMHYKFKAMAMAVRKRRKEESLEEDPPSPGPAAVSFSSHTVTSVKGTKDDFQGLKGALSQTEPEKTGPYKEISVIQHTSSFEKQESMSIDSQETEIEQEKSQEPKQTSTSRLVRQPNIQVPEILVTEEPDFQMASPPPSISISKEAEKEEFQWPQRSQSLAQLPAEKLPPKKKRLRLTETIQSSGESSFESASLPRSPSQDSNVSHTSSRSASFEESGKAETEMQVGAWSSQASHMLTVPGLYQHHHSHREMRRSASEQAPASPPHPAQIVETRSKSFDYGSLSPKPTSTSWKERRKCLLVKYATLGKPDEEEASSSMQSKPVVCQSYPSHSPLSIHEFRTSSTSRLSPDSLGKTLQVFRPSLPLNPLSSPDSFSPRQLARFLPVTTAISEVFSTPMFQQTYIHTVPSPLYPRQLHLAEHTGIPIQPFPTLLPIQYPTSGLTIQVPSGSKVGESSSSFSSLHSPGPSYHQLVTDHQSRPTIATCLEQLTPVVSLVVPVRLQTHIPTYASAMYTTISQLLATTRSQEPICCTAMVFMEKLQRSYLSLPTTDLKTCIPMSLPVEFGAESVTDGTLGPLGAGGSKRMLSPAGSLELSLDAQRQQKRVKEEGEGEQELNESDEKSLEERQGADKQRLMGTKEGEKNVKKTKELQESAGNKQETAEASPFKKEEREEERQKCVSVVEISESSTEPVYPSLHTTTSVSWCYLNYTKPNPSAHRNPQTSVYSSWSVSMYNPNLPGLSTKAVLSLLCSKQTHTSEIYTIATAPPLTTGKLVPASDKKPRASEVRTKPSSTPVKVKEENVGKKAEKEEKSKEEAPTTSKQSETPRIYIFEGGYKSNEEYVYVRGRGRGKYVCGECGIRCKKPSMLKKHIRTHTDIRPYVCKHCNFAFKTKGNLTKHMKSKAHGKKCQEMGVSESSIDEPDTDEPGTSESQVYESEEQEEHQFSDVEDSEDEDEDDDDNEEEEEELSSHDDAPSSCSTDTHQSDSGQGSQTDLSNPTAPEREDQPSPCRPWTSGRAASPGSKRALFSRKGFDVSPRAFSPGSEGSPIRSLSPRLELSSPGRHLSPSPERGPSPVRVSSFRPLSPLRPLSPARYKSSRTHLSPAPLRPQHRHQSSPGQFPWDSGAQARESQQERPGTPSTPQPQQRPSPPYPCLLPPALRLSHSDPSSHLPVTPRTVDRMFSHLPLHSQDQARMPYHMIPIGGIQMVQLRPRSCPKLERSSSSTSSPTSPKEDAPFWLGKRETSWSLETSQQGSLELGRTRGQGVGVRPSELPCPATSSTSAKSPPQHGMGEQRGKGRKQHCSSWSPKTHTFVSEASQEVGQDTSEGAERTSGLTEEACTSSQRIRQISEPEGPKEGPAMRHETTSERTAGDKSVCSGQSHDRTPDST